MRPARPLCRRARRSRAASVLGVLAAVLAIALAASPVRAAPLCAQPVPAALAAQPLLFATADQDVAQRGTPFRVHLELVTTVATNDEQERWVAAFEAAEPFAAPWAVLRAESTDVRVVPRGSMTVLELTRSFVVRVDEPGQARTAPVAVRVGDRRAVADPVGITIYDLNPAYYAAARSVIPVVAETRDQRRRQAGSGFLVAPDALVTAYHVVVGTDRVTVHLPDERTLTTDEVWALDPARDVAVLYVDPRAVRRAGLAPLPVSTLDASDGPAVSLTAGWRDGVQRSSEAQRFRDLRLGQRMFVSANPVGPGDSGGPLLDAAGEVLGVVVSGRSTFGDRALLKQSLCLATDLRPALAARAARTEPHRLRASLDLLNEAAPHARALAAAAALRARQPLRPHLEDLLEAADRLQDPTTLFLLGTTLEDVGDPAAARDAYTEALERADAFFPAAYALGHHYLRAGDFEQALHYFERTAAHPGYAHVAALGMARSHAERYDYRAAIEALHEVLRLDPSYAPALYLLAYAHLGLGDEATAVMLHTRLAHRSVYWAERLALNLRARPLRPISLAAPTPAF